MNRQVSDLSSNQESLLRIEGLVARVLFWGSLASVAITLAGFTLYLWNPDLRHVDLVRELSQQNTGDAVVFTSVSAIIHVAFASVNPLGTIGLGLLLLLCIPGLTVVLTMITFLRERDYRYTIISGVVLLVLAFSFFVGT